MPYEVRWEMEPHIISFRILGVITTEEVRTAMDAMIAMAQSYPDILVHTLIDTSDTRQLPPLTVMGREMQRMLRESPNRSVSTLYGVTPLVRFTLEVLMKITPLRVKVFETREDALEFTYRMVESESLLPDIAPLRVDSRPEFHAHGKH